MTKYRQPVFTESGGAGGSGDVQGPGSATDNAVARFDGTTGKTLQNSGLIVDDSGNVTVANGGAVLLSAVSGAPRIKRNSSALEIDLNTGTFTNSMLRCGSFEAQDSAAPSFFYTLQIGNTKQVLFSDGVDYGRGLAALSGQAGLKVTNGASGNGILSIGGAVCRGYTSSAGAASTTEYPNDKDWGLHKNTGSGVVSLAYNDGGVIKTVALS